MPMASMGRPSAGIIMVSDTSEAPGVAAFTNEIMVQMSQQVRKSEGPNAMP
mgnify:CR=1 FL=1